MKNNKRTALHLVAFFSIVLMSAASSMPIFAQSHISTQPHQAAVSAIVPFTQSAVRQTTSTRQTTSSSTRQTTSTARNNLRNSNNRTTRQNNSQQNADDSSQSVQLQNAPQPNPTQQTPAVTGPVNFFSAGSDGFLIKWSENGQGEHYQVTNLEIRLVAYSPSANEVAIYETDGGRVNRISVWDWKNLTRKYSRRFTDSITSLTYSANGTYLMIGTATVDGVVVMRSSNGSVVDLIKDSTGIVSYIFTSATEKTAVMYSPSGNISYYNLQTGRMSQRFTAEQGLSQPVLFNNGLYLAGVRNNTIYICYALTGQTLASYACSNPILLSTDKDTDLYYVEGNGRGNYTVSVIKNRNNRGVTSPESVGSVSGLRGNQSVNVGVKYGNTIALGTKSGDVYKTNIDNISNSSQMTQNMYDKILDVAPNGNEFYFLTGNAIYRSSYNSKQISRVASSNGQTRIIPFNNGAILWSPDTRDDVQLFDLMTNQLTTLFTPQASLQSVKLFGSKLLTIENYSNVNIFDLNTNLLSRIYSGTAIQDAVIMDDGNVYVAKSSATLPNTPLVAVNINTGETVPVMLDGNVSYSLSATEQTIYGVTYSTTGNSLFTYLFTYNTNTRRTETLIRLQDEDLMAFTYLSENNLYTNIGNDKLYIYNLRTRKNFQFDRSASMPLKVSESGDKAVVLNYDGSISWHDTSSAKVLASWYLTRDGRWTSSN